MWPRAADLGQVVLRTLIYTYINYSPFFGFDGIVTNSLRALTNVAIRSLSLGISNIIRSLSRLARPLRPGRAT